MPNLKKKRKEKEVVKKGEVASQKEPKQQKMAKDKGRASSVESKEDQSVAEVRHQHPSWAPQLELDGAAIPWSSTIREFQKRHAHYLAEALEQPLLLPKDMAALKNTRQPDLFLFLKRDLALISSSACFFNITLVILLFFTNIFVCHFCAGHPRDFYSLGMHEGCPK